MIDVELTEGDEAAAGDDENKSVEGMSIKSKNSCRRSHLSVDMQVQKRGRRLKSNAFLPTQGNLSPTKNDSQMKNMQFFSHNVGMHKN